MRVRTPSDLAGLVRDRRAVLVGWSQQELAGHPGISLRWIKYLESGTASIAAGKLLPVLTTLGRDLRISGPRPGLVWTLMPTSRGWMMSSRRRQALIEGRRAGCLRRSPREEVLLDYYDEYRFDPDATPLSCSPPLSARHHTTTKTSPFLWGLSPDNYRVLERWAREFQVSSRNVPDLLVHVGRDLPGARQIVDPDAARLDIRRS
jgi:HipA-like protein